MCGILGIVDYGGISNKSGILADLLIKSSRRGTDASGLAVFGNVKTSLLKLPGSAEELLTSKRYIEEIGPEVEGARVIIAQTRLATNGSPKVAINNQPIRVKGLYLVHNGIVVNSRELAGKYKLSSNESDSRVLARAISKETQLSSSLSKALIKVSGEVAGTINLITVIRMGGKIKIGAITNNGTMYIGENRYGLLITSEKVFLEKINRKYRMGLKISRVKPGSGWDIGEGGDRVEFKLRESLVSEERTVLLSPGKKILKHRLHKDIENIDRCAKCLLPWTTPNINFDNEGVCNYCLEYKKIEYRSDTSLKKLVSKYRSKGEKPDCILAFSGGRDSAYGLHYLVKELGMHPVAVTFDWGMVSDIGRRNQARMLGKLGVEHIIVTANLNKVRADIRKNLLAWLKRPDLGMVPILMQADKVTEYYVDVIKKELGVDLVFFCRGNELEREEFKAGYCGIKNADPGGVIHNYALIDKLKLLRYYLWQFLINPAYWNSSLWSSMLGYLVTYVVPHNYIYLWHYISWEENKIVKTLKDKYGWEDDGETGITWRIDDGSPAFYNYLYAQIQGFTENDSFRSRQIREGILTRNEALGIVKRENMPRYSALRWYFDKIGVDGDMVLSIIDRVKKRY